MRPALFFQILFSIMFFVDYITLGFFNLGVTRIGLILIYIFACFDALFYGKAISLGKNFIHRKLK